MIEIECRPELPTVKKYRAYCKCGCIFTFHETDKVNKCYGHGDFWNIIYCPNCHNDIGTPWDESLVRDA